MRVQICAVGRLRSGPERELVDDYSARFDRIGKSIGLGPIAIREVEDRKGGGPSAEAALLETSLPNAALMCCLDERGRALSSPEFAEQLARWRDQGRQDLAFLIGGADGLDPKMLACADFSLSLSRMVWPHRLVRVMLVEQLYRSAAILAGTPYHRS